MSEKNVLVGKQLTKCLLFECFILQYIFSYSVIDFTRDTPSPCAVKEEKEVNVDGELKHVHKALARRKKENVTILKQHKADLEILRKSHRYFLEKRNKHWKKAKTAHKKAMRDWELKQKEIIEYDFIFFKWLSKVDVKV